MPTTKESNQDFASNDKKPTVKDILSQPVGTGESSLVSQLKELKKSLEGTQNAVRELCRQVASHSLELNKYKNLATSPVPPATETKEYEEPTKGQIPKPHGNTIFKNPLDPAAMIEIAVVPREGLLPKAFSFPDPNNSSQLLTYTFRMDEGKKKIGADGNPEIDSDGNIIYLRKPAAHYCMPRMFAEAQLRNDGGLKFVLVSPRQVTIERRSPKLNTETVIIVADPEYQPALF